MTDTSGALPPAGWYPDPYGAPYERWWDGTQWTAHTTEAPAAPAAPVAPQPVAEPVVQQPVYQAPLQETPPFVTPAFQAPAETPAYQAPAVETPAYQSPAAQNPGVQNPGVQNPAYQAPSFQSPAYQTPAASPVPETPSYKTPAAETPYQPPAYEPYVPPVAVPPAAQTPAYAAPTFAAPASANDHAFDFGMLISGGADTAASNSGAGYAAEGTDAFGSWAGADYEEPPRNSAATAGLAFGILSFFLSAVAGIFGLIFGLVGMSKATRLKADGVEKTGRGKAFAGFLLSIVGSAVTAAAVLYFFFPSVLGLTPPDANPPASDGSSTIDDDALTQNGNLALTTGTAGVIKASGTDTPAVTFTVTAIQPDFACTSPSAVATVNGQFVAVTMEFTTAADYLSAMTSGGAMHMNATDWEGYLDDSADPLANSDAGTSCIAATEQLPADFPAGQTFSGTVVLDLDPAATSFSWSPTDVKDLDTTATRWEWALVAS